LNISKLEETQVETLLTSAFYEIPRFQRPYMWRDEHLTDFWQDLISEQSVDHFLGSMVTFTTPAKRRAIVDGQQRLTTIVLFLCVVRDSMASHGLAELAKKVHAYVKRTNRDGQPDYVLRSETSSPYFEDHILSFVEPELKREECKPGLEELSVDNAFKFLRAKVDAELEACLGSSKAIETALKRMRDKVLDLQVIHVGMEDQDEAYMVFETLNTRGMNLRTQDMVKNHVLKVLKAKRGSVDGARIRWTAAVQKLEKAPVPIGFDTFLLHQWLSTNDYTGKKQLYRAIRNQLLTKTSVESYLTLIGGDVELYRSMLETSYRQWPSKQRDVKRGLDALRSLRLAVPLPFLLSVMRAREADGLTARSELKAFRAVEDFHFIITAVMSRSSSGGVASMYARTGRLIYQAPDANARAVLISSFATSLKRKLPTQAEFEPYFAGLRCSNRYPDSAPVLKYALRRMLEVEGFPLPVDLSSVTVEHLWPQSKPSVDDGMTDDVIASPGNLILVSKELNGTLSDKSFTQKKRILRAANYPLDPILASTRRWTPECVEARTAWLSSNAWEKTFTVA
jgi:uncharacterized tellurite resistance protein B-like protein